MVKESIKLANKDVTIAYCYATEISFKKMTGCNISDFNPNDPEHVIYLILAAVTAYYASAGETAPVTDNDLIYSCEPEELTAALEKVFALHRTWYKIPDELSNKNEDKGKNA